MTNPTTNLEAAIIAAGANVAPRVTMDDIEASIDSEIYFTAAHGIEGALQCHQLHARHPGGGLNTGSLERLTICVLVLRNGYTVTGESACVSPENFKVDIGRRIARENAVEKIWPLMGFALREKLAARAQASFMTRNGGASQSDDVAEDDGGITK